MAIKTDKGEVHIEGSVNEILADLSVITETLREGGVPKILINAAIARGFDIYEKTNEKENTSKSIERLLKTLGVEN